jgi:hypothetical protein
MEGTARRVNPTPARDPVHQILSPPFIGTDDVADAARRLFVV